MAGNIVNFVFTADTKQMQAAMKKTSTNGAALGKALKIGMLGVTAAVTGGIVAFAKFEKGLSNIDTLLGGTGENIKEIGEGILKIGKEMPVSINDLTSAMYDVRSAGIAANQQFKVLRQSAVLATAGLSTTKEATNIMTSALNNFAEDGQSAAEVADTLFKTVKFGKTTISELSGSFGSVAPLIKAAQISLQDFSAATAALTTNGQSASEAQNRLRAALTSLKKPTANMSKIFRRLGVKDGQELLDTSENMVDAFIRVKDEADNMGTSIESVTGRVEAASAITALAGAQNEAYVNTLNAMTKGENALNDAFSKQNKTIAAQTQLVKNNMNIAFIRLGEALLPIVNTVLPLLSEGFEAIGEVIRKNSGAITGFFNSIVSIGTSVNDLWKIFTGGIGILETIGEVFAAVGTIIGGVAEFIKFIVDGIKAVVDVVDDLFKSIADNEGFQAIGSAFQKSLEQLSDKEVKLVFAGADKETKIAIAKQLEEQERFHILSAEMQEEYGTKSIENQKARAQKSAEATEEESAAKLEKMQEDDAAKLALQTEWYERDIEVLAQQRENNLISQEEFIAKRVAIEQKFEEDKIKLRTFGAKVTRAVDGFYQKSAVKQFEQNSQHLLNLQNSKNKEVARVGAAANIAQIAMDTPRAAMGAYAALAGIPIVGPALGIAAAAAAIAYGAEQISSVGKASFAVGTDNVTSDMTANIHKGEAIVPAKQNQFLQSGKLALTSPDAVGSGGGDTYITEVSMEGAVFDGDISEEKARDIADMIANEINERRIPAFPTRA